MSTGEPIEVRTMTRDELDFAMSLSEQEGWTPGVHDAGCFYTADPNGFFIGLRQGEPIGCISAVSYNGRFGFFGLYIVRPEFRGRGFGMQLWRVAMERLVGHNVGLDGVLAQQENYKKSGFRIVCRNVRFARQVTDAAPVHQSIAPASSVPFEQIAALDSQIFPESRDAFLREWLAQPEAGAFVARDGDRLTGYAMVRRSLPGWRIGPLAAQNRTVAERLCDAAEAHVLRSAGPGATLHLDVPEPNAEAMRLTSDRGMQPMFETARMYTGEPPKVRGELVYGVTTFELG